MRAPASVSSGHYNYSTNCVQILFHLKKFYLNCELRDFARKEQRSSLDLSADFQ